VLWTGVSRVERVLDEVTWEEYCNNVNVWDQKRERQTKRTRKTGQKDRVWREENAVWLQRMDEEL